MTRPPLAVTLGDPRGIGPEVVHAALATFRSRRPDVGVLVLGPEGPPHPFESYESVGRFEGSPESAGRVAARAIERGAQLCLAGEASALVTGPVHKPSLHAAGWRTPGVTELLKRLCGAERVGMLMAAERTELGGPLRVLLATTHLPLSRVPGAVTAAVLREQASLLHEALRVRWGLPEPRLALCALNPHASDGGLFGAEEAAVLEPAVAALREGGVSIEGPIPADTVFVRALSGEFDAVVAPYHDVGMAAFKTASFGGGVNVTLGLPFIRTSPDHGTAFDIAGTGHADPGSMGEALDLAVRLAEADLD